MEEVAAKGDILAWNKFDTLCIILKVVGVLQKRSNY